MMTLRKLMILSFIVSAVVSKAQFKKATMAPILAKGYYINSKGDTITGFVQTNPPFTTEFYKHFYFKSRSSGKPKLMDTQKVSAYGFENRHFVRIENNGTKEFAERLVFGRLRFYETRFPYNMNDPMEVESEYFVRDLGADEQNAELREIRKINPKFYKKNLKPYMKDQPVIWTDLDKFNFDKQTLIKAFKEYNKFYSSF